MSTQSLLADLLRMPSPGLTNVSFALTVELGELARTQFPVKVGILPSDAVQPPVPIPRDLAARTTASMSCWKPTANTTRPWRTSWSG